MIKVFILLGVVVAASIGIALAKKRVMDPTDE